MSILVEPKKIYVYSDETTFQINNNDIAGTGHLITDKPILPETIISALEGLRTEESINKRDNRTLSRQYFHASDDSHNAHSYLCRSIVRDIRCSFFYSYLDKKQLRRKNEKLYRLAFQLVSTKFFEEPYDINLIVEERSGISSAAITELIDSIYYSMEIMAYNIPSIISIYPKITFEVKTKHDPGLQVADFILWSVNRRLQLPADNCWFERLQLKEFEWHQYEDKSISGACYYLQSNIMIYNLKQIINYPFRVPAEFPDNFDIYAHYTLIEESINRFVPYTYTYASHLTSIVIKAQEAIQKPVRFFKERDLELIASAFLRLLDTIPIYHDFNNNSQNQWENLLLEKKLCGLLLGKGISNGRTRDAILRYKWRNI